MTSYLTTWGSNLNGELNIPERLSQPIGLNSNLVSGYRDVSKFYLGLRHGIVSKPSSQTYFKPLYSGIYITGYEPIRIPINTSWGDNTFFQLAINRTIGNLTFYYEKFDLGYDTTYAIDAQLGLIHGFGSDLIFSDISNATGLIVNWTLADLNSNGIPAGNLALYPRAFRDVKAGDGYVLALNSGNKITGWGNSGNPVISGQRFAQINAFDNIAQISAGDSHALVLFQNGFISGWGNNSFSQLNIDNMLVSGEKISTKTNYNLAMGLRAPSFTRITGNNLNRTAFNITGLGRFNFDKLITGLEFQFSTDRNNWSSFVFPTGLNNQNFLSFTGSTFPTGNIDYYVRLKEYYDTSDERNGWRNVFFSPINVGFRSVDMSYNGQNQTVLMVSGNQRTYPYLSSGFGTGWLPITGASQIPFLNDHIKTTVKLSRFGNLQLIAGPRTAAGSGPYQVLLSTNSGINWTGLSGSGGFGPGFSTAAINHINASEDFKVIAVTRQNSFLIISHNTGTGWFQASGATGAGSRNWEQIAMSEDGRYMLASEVDNGQNNQVLFKSNNSGLSWTSTSGILSGRFTPVEMSKNGQIQVVGSSQDGPLFISYDMGSTWVSRNQSINGIPNASWSNISMSRDGKYIAATESNGIIFHSDNSGFYWSGIILNRNLGPIAMSSGGKYITAINKQGSNTGTVAVNANFGLLAFDNSFTITNTGSSSIFNPSGNNFNIWTDYRVFGWGGGDSNVARIPTSLENERIIDIAAGYNNNLILTENPIAEKELNTNLDLSQFLNSNVLVSGAGITEYNRTFVLDGQVNNRPLYRYYDEISSIPTNILIFWNDVSWGLYSGFNNLIYYSLNDVEYPWLGTWTTDNNDYLPVPDVLEIPFYPPEPTPLPCVGFYFDTN